MDSGYTWPSRGTGHGTEFYGDFAENAWLRPAQSLTRHLIVPHATVFTVGLILFQAAIASAILTRTDATGAALIAGGCFALRGKMSSLRPVGA